MSNYTVIDYENVKDIQKALKGKGGRILIAGPGFWEHEEGGQIDWYDHPQISKWHESYLIHLSRGSKKINGEDWQTDWEKDREFTLRRVPPRNSDEIMNAFRDSTEKIIIKGYEFNSGFQTGGEALFRKKRVSLYVPKKADIKPAFELGVNHLISRLTRKEFTLGERKLLVDYALNDIRTGEHFMANVQLGRAYDEAYM